MGEGKSVTAINLAYTFAEAGKNILLIEADMRRPNIAKRLNLKRTPGLSNFLVGLSAEVIQKTKRHNNLYVIAAGDIPPNPAELLGSSKMQNCLKTLSERFEYIIIDLPPVDIVSDALALTRLVDGFVFAVRQNYASKQAVREAMYRMKIVDARVLGFVLTCTKLEKKSYKYKRGKYAKYGDYYQYGYSNHDKLNKEMKNNSTNDLKKAANHDLKKEVEND